MVFMRFLVFASFLFVLNVCASDYKISLLEFSQDNYLYSITSINDKGQILGVYGNNLGNNIRKTYIYDQKKGVTFIDSKDQSIHPIAINNACQVLGCSGNKPFVWSKAFGFRWIEVNDSRQVHVYGLNDLGQVIGFYHDARSDSCRPFMWDYGVITDMGPGSEFSQSIEALGYHVMNISLKSVNNRGELVGHFSYGKFNKKTNKYVVVGGENFFWNGDIHILPKLEDSTTVQFDMKMNNRGVVLLYNYNETSYLWDKESGLQKIDGFIGRALNDSNIVLGMMCNLNDMTEARLPAIWKEGSITTIATLLDVENISNISFPYAEDYSIEGLSFQNFSLYDFGLFEINNKGQIPCLGSIWGDNYPCLIEPNIQENSSQIYFDKGDDKDDDNRTLLHHASGNGDFDVCQSLIDFGLNPNDQDKWGQTPLYIVAEMARYAKTAIEKKLLKYCKSSYCKWR